MTQGAKNTLEITIFIILVLVAIGGGLFVASLIPYPSYPN